MYKERTEEKQPKIGKELPSTSYSFMLFVLENGKCTRTLRNEKAVVPSSNSSDNHCQHFLIFPASKVCPKLIQAISHLFCFLVDNSTKFTFDFFFILCYYFLIKKRLSGPIPLRTILLIYCALFFDWYKRRIKAKQLASFFAYLALLLGDKLAMKP